MNRLGLRSIIFVGIVISLLLLIGVLFISDFQSQETESSPAKTVPADTGSIPSHDPLFSPDLQLPQQVLPHLRELLSQNSDLAGWITIPGTQVDYPVMISPESDWDYYLNRDFYGNDDAHGMPYLWPQLNPSEVGKADLSFIFAHNMRDGSRFGDVARYRDLDFLNAHPVINFSSLYAERSYQVAYVFQVHSIPDVADYFYHPQSGIEGQYRFTYLFQSYWEDRGDFDEFMSLVRTHALLETGIEVEYGDRMIALWTCSTAIAQGRRLIVLAVER